MCVCVCVCVCIIAVRPLVTFLPTIQFLVLVYFLVKDEKFRKQINNRYYKIPHCRVIF